MAVKLMEVQKFETRTADTEKNVIVNLFADAKADITDDMRVIGMPNTYKMQMGSSVITSDGEFAFLKSDGTWNWI